MMTRLNIVNPIDRLNPAWRSPRGEQSVMKGIPMRLYTSDTRRLLRTVLKQPLRFRFRGPRRGDGRDPFLNRLTCLKARAVTFSVYMREQTRNERAGGDCDQ